MEENILPETSSYFFWLNFLTHTHTAYTYTHTSHPAAFTASLLLTLFSKYWPSWPSPLYQMRCGFLRQYWFLPEVTFTVPTTNSLPWLVLHTWTELDVKLSSRELTHYNSSYVNMTWLRSELQQQWPDASCTHVLQLYTSLVLINTTPATLLCSKLLLPF